MEKNFQYDFFQTKFVFNTCNGDRYVWHSEIAHFAGTTKGLANTSTFIWLDQSIGLTDDDKRVEDQLRQTLPNLFVCNDPHESEEYICNATEEAVVLIASGKLAQGIVPRTHHLKQLSACYIFCANKDPVMKWSQKYPKVNRCDVRFLKIIDRFFRHSRYWAFSLE
jgi:hypothetical protein